MRVFLSILFVLTATAAYAWPGAVTRVVDGDTLVLEALGQNSVKIRLYGIDCPEGGQEAGGEATETAEHLTKGQTFEVEEQGLDRYGRIVAILWLPDGSTLQEGLLRAGVAWVAPRYCKRPECREWKAMEETASRERRGLWRYPQPIPPWEWRKLAK